MHRTLGRKQNSSNADWLYATAHIEELITEAEVDAFADEAVKRIKAVSKEGSVAYGWSGGKDSIVLGKLCEAVGVTRCFFGHCDLEFHTFLNWALSHLPEGCQVINTGIGFEWLSKHPDMLFADDAKRLNLWYKIVQREAFSSYFAANNVSTLIVGHRTLDGNVCGADGYIRKKSGEVRFAPIADWPHEVVLGYIHYKGLELPPTYQWEDGYVFGPTPWPIWGHPKTHAEGWRMIYELEPAILPEAAKWFDSAQHFLETEVRS